MSDVTSNDRVTARRGKRKRIEISDDDDNDDAKKNALEDSVYEQIAIVSGRDSIEKEKEEKKDTPVVVAAPSSSSSEGWMTSLPRRARWWLNRNTERWEVVAIINPGNDLNYPLHCKPSCSENCVWHCCIRFSSQGLSSSSQITSEDDEHDPCDTLGKPQQVFLHERYDR